LNYTGVNVKLSARLTRRPQYQVRIGPSCRAAEAPRSAGSGMQPEPWSSCSPSPSSRPAPSLHSEDELEQARERLKDLRGEFRAAEASLKQVRAAIVSLTNQISEATAQLEALDFARQETGSAIRHSEAETEELQSRLDARARDVYISGPAGVLELILEAESLADLADPATSSASWETPGTPPAHRPTTTSSTTPPGARPSAPTCTSTRCVA